MDRDTQLDALGGRLRRLRLGLGLPQREVADRAGLDVRYYSRVERGHVNPSYLTLVRVADALQACPGALAQPLGPASEVGADVCAGVSRLILRGDEARLAQTRAFLAYVLEVEMPGNCATCPVAHGSTPGTVPGSDGKSPSVGLRRVDCLECPPPRRD